MVDIGVLRNTDRCSASVLRPTGRNRKKRVDFVCVCVRVYHHSSVDKGYTTYVTNTWPFANQSMTITQHSTGPFNVTQPHVDEAVVSLSEYRSSFCLFNDQT